MIIGTNKETKNREYRVALLPSGVREFVERGHVVLVERGAGEGAGWPDREYEEAGAALVDDSVELFGRADLVYKVKEPMPHEYDLMRGGQVLLTFIHSAGNRPLCDKLLETGVWGIAFEDVELDDGRLPLLEPMSFVAGYLGMYRGFELLQTTHGGFGKLPGGMAGALPCHVMILGAGSVGSGALHVAIGLGADVTLLDIDEGKLRSMFARYPGITTLHSNRENIARTLKHTDILLNAVSWPKTRKGHLVTRKMLRTMPERAAVVDVAADVRGSLESCLRQTTHDDPVYVVDGHPHYVVANIPSLAAQSASEALARVTLPYALDIADKGQRTALMEDVPLRRGLTCLDGQMVRSVTAEWYGCPHLSDSAVVKLLSG